MLTVTSLATIYSVTWDFRITPQPVRQAMWCRGVAALAAGLLIDYRALALALVVWRAHPGPLASPSSASSVAAPLILRRLQSQPSGLPHYVALVLAMFRRQPAERRSTGDFCF
jgi:hypothetical protein